LNNTFQTTASFIDTVINGVLKESAPLVDIVVLS